jgi:hypothetical protein
MAAKWYPYFRLNEVDREFYERHLRDFLPPRLFDFHAHVGEPQHFQPLSLQRLRTNWALECGHILPFDDLREAYRQLFPDSEVRQLCFPFPIQEARLRESNAYVADKIKKGKTFGLYTSHPAEDESGLRQNLINGRFSGLKPYPDLVRRKKEEDISIFDFAPKSHLRVVEDLGLVLLLHLPRPGRLQDPANIAELHEIAREFPRLKLVIAHVGRSYCTSFVMEGLPALRDCPAFLYDIAAVLNPAVLEFTLREVGPRRVLWGTDFPILFLRGKQEWHGDKYVNFTSQMFMWNVERRPPEEEARYTLFIYEQLRALREACERAGVVREGAERVLYSNAAGLLKGCVKRDA